MTEKLAEFTMADMDAKIGDVIQVQGPKIPVDLWDKFFTVLGFEGGNMQLSPPYLDEGCIVPYTKLPNES